MHEAAALLPQHRRRLEAELGRDSHGYLAAAESDLPNLHGADRGELQGELDGLRAIERQTQVQVDQQGQNGPNDAGPDHAPGAPGGDGAAAALAGGTAGASAPGDSQTPGLEGGQTDGAGGDPSLNESIGSTTGGG